MEAVLLLQGAVPRWDLIYCLKAKYFRIVCKKVDKAVDDDVA